MSPAEDFLFQNKGVNNTHLICPTYRDGLFVLQENIARGTTDPETRRCTTVQNSDDQAIPLRWA